MRALFLLIPTVSGIMPLTAATAARPPIGNIANFVVKTDNLDEARRFYVGVLGYEEVFRHKRAVSGPAELSVFKVSERQTCATRNSTLAKSSMLILPSGMVGAGLAGGGDSCLTGAVWVVAAASLGWTGVAPVAPVCSSIFCILSTADLSALGNTACTSPSFVPSCNCPQIG